MLLSKLQGGCKSPILAQKWPENLIFMLSIVFHGIVWYCMDMLCILWHCIVLHVIALHCMVLHGIVLYQYGIAWYCIVGFGAGCISQDTYLLYICIYLYGLTVAKQINLRRCYAFLPQRYLHVGCCLVQERNSLQSD